MRFADTCYWSHGSRDAIQNRVSRVATSTWISLLVFIVRTSKSALLLVWKSYVKHLLIETSWTPQSKNLTAPSMYDFSFVFFSSSLFILPSIFFHRNYSRATSGEIFFYDYLFRKDSRSEIERFQSRILWIKYLILFRAISTTCRIRWAK